MQILNEPEATPLELVDYMVMHHGKDWVNWEPETIWQILDVDRYEQSVYNKNKLQALQMVLSNSLFWKDWLAFEKCVLAFNNVPPRFDVIESVSPAQMAYAIRIARQVRKIETTKQSGRLPAFDVEVKKYIAIRSYLDGLIYLPEPLDFAQNELDKLTGLGRHADTVKAATNNPKFEIEEDPISIGAAKAMIVRSYAYSDSRKAIV